MSNEVPMKKNSIHLSLLTALFVLFFTSPLFAIGLGAYIPGSRGIIEWEDNSNNDNSDLFKLGIGFILDTAVAQDRIFNYRLNLGFALTKIINETDYNIDGFDYHLYNTFGFGIIRTKDMRFWIGLQIGFGVIIGEYDVHEETDINSFTDVYASTGLAAGVNLHIGDRFSLGLEGGLRTGFHKGTGKIEITNYNYGSFEYDYSGSEIEIFMNISAIFRINDYM